MNIVITGALGHIGSALIRRLPIDIPGCRITMIDDMSAQRYCSLFDLPTNGNYRFHEESILTMDLEPVMRDADAVVHLAAITDAASSFDDPEAVERVNLYGTKRVADVCAATRTPLIFLSTTSVYGPQGDMVDEDCPASDLQPQSPYATSKQQAELWLTELGRTADLRFIICRFGTIFGISPGMRFHTAVNKFCWLAAQNRPLTVWTDAYDQIRPYLDLGDGISALTLLLQQGEYDGRIYNVVTANLTVRHIVDTIKETMPDTSVEFVDTPIMNQLSYGVAANRIRARGWIPTGNARKAIRETLARLNGIWAAGGSPNTHDRSLEVTLE